MLRKLNCFLNIVIGSFIGVFIGFGIYKFWHFKTYPNLYAINASLITAIPSLRETSPLSIKNSI